jgi:hypothetical protein
MQAQETTTPLKPTRASFVRGLDVNMPIAEVIERGREAGLEIKPGDIHAARYYMRQAAAAQNTGAPQLVRGTTTVAQVKRELSTVHAVTRGNEAGHSDKERSGSNGASKASAAAKSRKPTPILGGSPEEQLRLIVMRIGTERARSIIEQVEKLALRE